MEYTRNILMNSFLFLLLFFFLFFFVQINQNKIDIDDPGLTFRIKISEDGAKMTKLTIFIVISCSLFNNDEDPMSSKGKRYCQYLIYPLFLKLPIALVYMFLQVSLNACMVYIHWNNRNHDLLPTYIR